MMARTILERNIIPLLGAMALFQHGRYCEVLKMLFKSGTVSINSISITNKSIKEQREQKVHTYLESSWIDNRTFVEGLNRNVCFCNLVTVLQLVVVHHVMMNQTHLDVEHVAFLCFHNRFPSWIKHTRLDSVIPFVFLCFIQWLLLDYTMCMRWKQ